VKRGLPWPLSIPSFQMQLQLTQYAVQGDVQPKRRRIFFAFLNTFPNTFLNTFLTTCMNALMNTRAGPDQQKACGAKHVAVLRHLCDGSGAGGPVWASGRLGGLATAA
jgi:hypothetical protein